MSALCEIAYFKNRRDEAPNLALARRLASSQDRDGIQEIAENLRNSNPQIRSDCIKVLYEIGEVDPELIAGYADVFLSLLASRDNRMVWGAMAALAAIAPVRAEMLCKHRVEIQRATAGGSVIARDNGVKALALIAAERPAYARQIFPFLVGLLKNCRPKEVAQYAETTSMAVNPGNRAELVRVLEGRLSDLSPSQASRVKKVLRSVAG